MVELGEYGNGGGREYKSCFLCRIVASSDASSSRLAMTVGSGLNPDDTGASVFRGREVVKNSREPMSF